MKEKLYKLFLILMVSLSLGSGSLAQNEIRKLLEALSGTGDAQVYNAECTVKNVRHCKEDA